MPSTHADVCKCNGEYVDCINYEDRTAPNNMPKDQRVLWRKQKKRIYLRAYYKRNSAKIKADVAKWYLDNKEAKNIYSRDYQKRHPEKRAETQRRWVKKNPKKRAEIQRLYRRKKALASVAGQDKL